ncbi:hypothetical protein F5Y16DRAFT_257327 [Xylariaceae sp. FL0255]|nr:hypothetical protein F5Y16DRAFT_257327 [Xylariaceae sp. FL0255]
MMRTWPSSSSYCRETARILYQLPSVKGKNRKSTIPADRVDAIMQSQHEERVAEHDRNLSNSFSNNKRSPEPPAKYIYIIRTDNGDDNSYCSTSDGDDGGDGESLAGSQPESSAWGASLQGRKSQERRVCEACQDQKHFAELFRAPCNHEYCRQCLERLFKDAIVDESLFPPRCCRQTMPLDKCQSGRHSRRGDLGSSLGRPKRLRRHKTRAACAYLNRHKKNQLPYNYVKRHREIGKP